MPEGEAINKFYEVLNERGYANVLSSYNKGIHPYLRATVAAWLAEHKPIDKDS